MAGHTTTRSSTIGARFEAFHAANPHIIRRIETHAATLIASGVARFGIKQIFEKIRWDHTISTSGETLKLNNDYSSRYARLLIERQPHLCNHIETRELKAQ